MTTTISTIPEETKARGELEFASGDTVKVWSKIKENDGKTRLQAFTKIKHQAQLGVLFYVWYNLFNSPKGF